MAILLASMVAKLTSGSMPHLLTTRMLILSVRLIMPTWQCPKLMAMLWIWWSYLVFLECYNKNVMLILFGWCFKCVFLGIAILIDVMIWNWYVSPKLKSPTRKPFSNNNCWVFASNCRNCAQHQILGWVNNNRRLEWSKWCPFHRRLPLRTKCRESHTEYFTSRFCMPLHVHLQWKFQSLPVYQQWSMHQRACLHLPVGPLQLKAFLRLFFDIKYWSSPTNTLIDQKCERIIKNS